MPEAFVVESKPRGHIGPEVLDDNVRPLDEPRKNLVPIVRLQVQTHASLIPVRHRKIGTEAVMRRRQRRMSSGRVGLSTLITSAPRSDST